MEKENKVQYAAISAILLFAAAVFWLPTILQKISALSGPYASGMTPFWLLTNLATVGGCVWLGLNLLKQKRDKTVVIGVAILAAAVLARFIFGFDPASMRYQRFFYDYSSGSGYKFSFLVFLPYALELAGYALLLVFANALLNTENEQKQESAKQLWFLPFALTVAKFPLSLLAMIFARNPIDIFSGGLTGLILFGLEAAFMWFAMTWFAFPEGREDAEYHGDGYKSIIPHILLCIFTLGIYQLIWICRVTKYLNARIDSEPAMKPWHQVVAGMLLPFYLVYWVYKSAQRLDAAARERGVQSNLTMLCTLLQVFSFFNVILPSIFMQDKLNTLALLDNGEVSPSAPCVQTGPTWGGAAPAPMAAEGENTQA